MCPELHEEVVQLRERVNGRLDELVPPEDTPPEQLHKAIRYSLVAPGKRIRPLMTLLTATRLGADAESALDPACAIEMVHTASLIVDDMPFMDDAEMRRGRQANHRVFGQDVASLAAFDLLSRAFGVMAGAPGPRRRAACRAGPPPVPDPGRRRGDRRPAARPAVGGEAGGPGGAQEDVRAEDRGALRGLQRGGRRGRRGPAGLDRAHPGVRDEHGDPLPDRRRPAGPIRDPRVHRQGRRARTTGRRPWSRFWARTRPGPRPATASRPRSGPSTRWARREGPSTRWRARCSAPAWRPPCAAEGERRDGSRRRRRCPGAPRPAGGPAVRTHGRAGERQPRAAHGRAPGPSRTERRRQDDAGAVPQRPGGARLGRDRDVRSAAAPKRREAGARLRPPGDRPLPGPDRSGEPRGLRPLPRAAGPGDPRGGRAGRWPGPASRIGPATSRRRSREG